MNPKMRSFVFVENLLTFTIKNTPTIKSVIQISNIGSISINQNLGSADNTKPPQTAIPHPTRIITIENRINTNFRRVVQREASDFPVTF